ncbi:metallophosphoesterase, partial [Campylobacter sp. 2018MI35]
KIHHIGDIQGCYSVLKKYLKKIKKDEFYIFLGDYINRGIENSKVMKLLLKLYYLPNVCLLEGNHERNLIKWANNENIYSKEFNNFTLKDFYKEKITQKDAKKIYSYLKECFWYEYYDKKVFCCHGGINFLPKEEKLSLISSDNFINGIGTYDESQIIADEFKKNTPKNYYQIFGHRNRFKLPIRLNSKVFLCEAKVDKGGFLRIVTLDRQGFDCIELKNKIYKKNSYNFPKNN